MVGWFETRTRIKSVQIYLFIRGKPNFFFTYIRKTLTKDDEPRDWLVWLLANHRMRRELRQYGFVIPDGITELLDSNRELVDEAVALAAKGRPLFTHLRHILYDAY
jgi:hypothetical protein